MFSGSALCAWSHIQNSTFKVRLENKPADPLSKICSKRRKHTEAERGTKWEGGEQEPRKPGTQTLASHNPPRGPGG